MTSAISALSSVYQPLDGDLTAIAALTTTAFGRGFLAFADAAAVRAALDLEAGTDFPSQSTFDDHSARHEDGGADEISVQGLSGTPAALQSHLDDTVDAHDATAISFAPAGTIAATTVQAAIEEVAAEAGGGSPTGSAGGALDGTYPNPGLAASVAGAGLAETSDVLSVNVDGSTIEINVDTLRVKAGGIGANEIAANAVGSSELADDAVDTNAIANGAVTAAKVAADVATQAELDAHTGDTTDAHAGTAITNTPAGSIAATTVQAAINELDTEKAAVASAVMDGDAAGGVLGGTYPNPSFAADMATQAELDAHISDSSAAHAASAVSADSTTLVGTGTDVQAVLEELDNGIADHLADATAAHAATAISFSPAGTIAATTVQAAIEEVASEAGGGGGTGSTLALYVFTR